MSHVECTHAHMPILHITSPLVHEPWEGTWWMSCKTNDMLSLLQLMISDCIILPTHIDKLKTCQQGSTPYQTSSHINMLQLRWMCPW
jgi:hypothetical protein